MRLSSSVKLALLILAALIGYFAVRSVFSGNGGNGEEVVAESLFTVQAREVSPEPWRDEIIVRGRTEALRKVVVRAETGGVVVETPTELGANVSEGDVLCRIRIDARQAGLAEARAAYQKAKLDFEAADQLAKEGFRSETGVAAARAALDLARANLEQAQLAVERTAIVAPFDGVFDNRAVEVGDFMSVGDACGSVIQQTPYLVVGSVSERDVARIEQGDRGVARLTNGEEIEGRVRFVATAADEATRTFEVQLELPNDDGRLRDGMTASFTVFAERRNAHLAPRSAILLDDDGRLGVRVLDADERVHFAPVKLLGESSEGVWLGGLEGTVRLITRGQDFVIEGQHVLIADDGNGAS